MAPGDKAKARREAAELAEWQRQRTRVQSFLARVKTFAGATNADGATLPLPLLEEEHALLVLPNVQLIEPRRLPSLFMGGDAGFTFHVARGTGDDEQPTPIDTGVVTVTDQRTVFSGSLHTRTWDYSKVIGFHSNIGPPAWTAIAVSDRQRVSGVRYDIAHAEEFRFALVLGLARSSDAEDSLVEDLNSQLEELDRERPDAVPPPGVVGAATGPLPTSASTPDTVTGFAMPAAMTPLASATPSAAPAWSPTQPMQAQPTPTQPTPTQPMQAQPMPAQLAPQSVVSGSSAPAASASPNPVSPATGSTLPPPGWYHDPYRTARLRWWDGHAWTGHVAP